MNSFLTIEVRVLAANARRQLASLNAAMTAVSMRNATEGVNGFGRAWNALNLGRMGSQMQWLGRQIEYNFTLPIVAAGAAAMTMAMQNEKAFTRIEKVYGDATRGADYYEKELQSLGRAFVALSNHFGVAQKDALNIAADWAAAGASGLALAKSVKLTMETMVLGELEAGQATKSLIAIQAQYGLTIDELTNTLHELNMVENQTGASMGDLIDGFTRAAGVARSAGVSTRELAANIAALTPATGSAANAGNALKTIFSRLISPTDEVNEALRYMGIQINELGWQGANAQQKLLVMAKAFQKLTDSEKGFVASTIATRYQVNRFEVLMAELVNEHGYYARAMQSTEKQTVLYAQAQKELNAVLSSSPQRLKIIWTQLQNASADIIQPLIPVVLWLAEAVQKLIQKFSELSPATQKFILFALALLAVVGPLVRYLGAVQVLIFELAKGLRLLALPLVGLVKLFALLGTIPLVSMLTSVGKSVRDIAFGAGRAILALPAAFAIAMSRIGNIVIAGIVLIRKLWITLMTAVGIVTSGGLAFIVGLWNKFWMALAVMIGVAGRNIVRLTAVMLIKMEAAIIAFAAWSGRIWWLITTRPLVLVRNMWLGIIAITKAVIPTIRAVSTAVTVAMTGPWGVALVALVALVVLFWDDLVKIFENGVRWLQENQKQLIQVFKPLSDAAEAANRLVIRAFNALPQGVRNALLAVVRIVHAAAMKVYELFSYFNPWARHSPSLVENVTTGVAAIMSQYAMLGTATSGFAQAADDLELFAEATRRVNRSAEANKYAEIRRDLLALASDAVGPFDRLIQELYGLEDQLVVVGKALKAQETITDELKRNLDSVNDALDTQQDVLRAMREEADKYEDVINRLNGDLEVLTGTREALRTAGAGSDILATYDAQIAALREQKAGVADQLAEAEAAYAAQDQLVKDLIAARDALQASYDIEAEKLRVLRDEYDAIGDRIRDITSAINDFASAVTALKSSGGAGGGGADIIPADFADVGGAGQLGREGGFEDQSAEIDAFTKEMADKTKNMFGLFDFLEPVKKAWGKVKTWMGDNIAPIFSLALDGIKSVFSNLPNPFEKMEFGGFLETLKSAGSTVMEFFESLWKLIGPPLTEIRDIIYDAFGKAFKEIGPELAKFKELVGPIGELFQNIWTVLQPLAALVGGMLLMAFKIIAEVLANVLGPVLNWIIDIVKNVIRVFRGLIEFVVGIFTGDWELALKGASDFFIGTWEIIWSTIKNFGLLIWGIAQGIVEGIVGFFVWLWDELVGHSIIPDIVEGIIWWFEFLWKIVQFIWNALLTGLEWAWENILKPIFDAFVKAIENLKNVASRVFDWMRDGWNFMVAVIQYAKNMILAYIQEMINRFFALLDFLGGLKGKIDSAISGLWNGLISGFKSALNSIISLWNRLDLKVDINVPSWIPGIGGKTFSISDIFPDIPMLERGGMVAKEATAIVGEGKRGYPEYVIPTDPAYRKRALALFAALGDQLGMNAAWGSGDVLKAVASKLTRGVMGDRVTLMARGGILGGRGMMRGRGDSGIVIAAGGSGNTYNFNGDLVFPNVKNGSDANEFIKNLRALAGS